MAGGAVEITVTDREFEAAFRRLREATADLRPALLEIGEYLLQSTERRFREQRDPQGQPWAPLSDDYRARKRKNADLILVLNGYLADFAAPQVTADSVSVGSNRVYAAAHQFGRPEINLPARPFLGLNEEDRAEILAIIDEHLARAVRG